MLLLLPTMGMLGGCAVYHDRLAGEHMSQARTLFEEDDLNAATSEFEDALTHNPESAAAHSGLGAVYKRRGEYEKAAVQFASALRIDSTRFKDTFHLGQAYTLLRRIPDAIRAYMHACELRPDHYDSHLNLGVCLQQVGDAERAVDAFEQAIRIDSDSPQAHVNLGVALDAIGRHYEAITAYKDSFERDPEQPLVLVNLAHTYFHQGRIVLAEAAFEEAARLDPTLAAAHEGRGYCQFKLKEYFAACDSYEWAVMCDPRSATALVGLGTAKMMLYIKAPDDPRFKQEGLDCWRRSLKLNPNQPALRELLGKYQNTITVSAAHPKTR